MSKLCPSLIAFLAGASMLTASSDAEAGAFSLHERSVKASGRAFAGTAAATDDPAIVSYNPAGMTELPGSQIAVGAYSIMPRARISDEASDMTVGPVSGIPVSGNPSGQGFDPQPSGYFDIATPVTRDLWIGLAASIPFGLKARYDDDFFGRYDSLKNKLVVIDIAPAVAYRLNDVISIGGSVNIQHADVTLINALPNPLDPLGPNPASDGLFTVNGSDWSMGFTLGVHIRPTDALDIGFSYVGEVTHNLTGDATTDFAGTQTVSAASADLKLPDVWSLGLAYRLSEKTTLLAQLHRFGWKRFDEVRIVLEDGSQFATTELFRNSWSAAIGAETALTPTFGLRAGIQYEETANRDQYRSTIIPDTDRIWGTIGASMRLSDRIAVDLSYAHMFANKEPINRVNSFPLLATTVRTIGNTKTSSNVLGVGLRSAF